MMTASFYVSATGNDNGPGTEQEPFATLEQARNSIRKMRAQRKPATGVTMWLREGVHALSSTFRLDKEDSGTRASPISYGCFSRGKTSSLWAGDLFHPRVSSPYLKQKY